MKLQRYRSLAFASLMSCATAMLVSACILCMHGVPRTAFLAAWAKSFLLAWPIVFTSILAIAPQINRFLDYLFDSIEEKNSE